MSLRRRMAMAVAALPVSLVVLPVGAQADGIHGCQVASGTEVATFTSATTSAGTITGSPLITGTTAFSVTSAGSNGTYTGTLQDSTSQGSFVSSDVGVLRTDGTFTEVGLIQGSSSTGIFHGSVGTILFDGSQTSPGTFTSRVVVAVCLS
jgi:hypothetical protein